MAPGNICNCFSFNILCDKTNETSLISINMSMTGFINQSSNYTGLFSGASFSVSKLYDNYWYFYNNTNPAQVIFSSTTENDSPCELSYTPVNMVGTNFCTGYSSNSKIYTQTYLYSNCTDIDSFIGDTCSCRKVNILDDGTSIIFKDCDGGKVLQLTGNSGDEVILLTNGMPILANDNTSLSPYGNISTLSPTTYKTDKFCNTGDYCCLSYQAFTTFGQYKLPPNNPSGVLNGYIKPTGTFNGKPFYSFKLWQLNESPNTQGTTAYIIYNNSRWELYELDTYGSHLIGGFTGESYALIGYTTGSVTCPTNGYWTMTGTPFTFKDMVLGISNFKTTLVDCPKKRTPSTCPDLYGYSPVITNLPLGVICNSNNSTTNLTNNGNLTLEITGGTPPYNIMFDDGFNITTNYGTYNRPNLYPRTYSISVSDSYPDFTVNLQCTVGVNNIMPTTTTTTQQIPLVGDPTTIYVSVQLPSQPIQGYVYYTISNQPENNTQPYPNNFVWVRYNQLLTYPQCNSFILASNINLPLGYLMYIQIRDITGTLIYKTIRGYYPSGDFENPCLAGSLMFFTQVYKNNGPASRLDKLAFSIKYPIETVPAP